MLNDIGDLPGPDYNAIQKRHVPQEKLDEANDLATQLDGVEKRIKRQQEIQSTLQQSMSNVETALTKIADLQRLSIEGGGKPSEVDRQAMENARSRFTQRRTNTSRPTRRSPRSTTNGINSNNRSQASTPSCGSLKTSRKRSTMTPGARTT